MSSTIKETTKKRMRRDIRLRIAVTMFGGLVLLTMVILIAHLISQAVPLAYTPQFTFQHSVNALPESRFVASADALERQPIILQTSSCSAWLAHLQKDTGTLSTDRQITRPCDSQFAVVESAGEHHLITVSASGMVRVSGVRGLQLQANTAAQASAGALSLNEFSFALPQNIWQHQKDWQIELSPQWLVATVYTKNKVLVYWVNRQQPTRTYTHIYSAKAKILTLPDTGQTLAYRDKQLLFFGVKGDLIQRVEVDNPVSWWQALPKSRSLFIASEFGEVTRWVLKNDAGNMLYEPTYTVDLAQGEQPATIMAHPSENAMVMATSSERLLLLNRVSGEVVQEYHTREQVSSISWYADRLYLLSAGQLEVVKVQFLSGITTWASLFEPQIYEGYRTANQVWQTSSGSDFQEQKYSLVPLLIGSLKASLLALVIAIPMSFGAAVYTGFFARQSLRNWIKPGLEMLEAIPSVLIGFIAAIWLAPLAANILITLALFLILIPLAMALIAWITPVIVEKTGRWRPGTELLFALVCLLATGYFAMTTATDWVLAGLDISYTSELLSDTDSPIGKNTVVVALALGVAISPGIYSLTEDAIAGVPDELKNASYALGATRLQTLQKVVIQVATPGILAAIMLGFGRAFGETMIVLMVTGNTPVSSWSLFEGLRALTANLAIELPEADVGSTHYQILFLTACILFLFTFVINTVAELLRQRLRRRNRYG